MDPDEQEQWKQLDEWFAEAGKSLKAGGNGSR